MHGGGAVQGALLGVLECSLLRLPPRLLAQLLAQLATPAPFLAQLVPPLRLAHQAAQVRAQRPEIVKVVHVGVEQAVAVDVTQPRLAHLVGQQRLAVAVEALAQRGDHRRGDLVCRRQHHRVALLVRSLPPVPFLRYRHLHCLRCRDMLSKRRVRRYELRGIVKPRDDDRRRQRVHSWHRAQAQRRGQVERPRRFQRRQLCVGQRACLGRSRVRTCPRQRHDVLLPLGEPWLRPARGQVETGDL